MATYALRLSDTYRPCGTRLRRWPAFGVTSRSKTPTFSGEWTSLRRSPAGSSATPSRTRQHRQAWFDTRTAMNEPLPGTPGWSMPAHFFADICTWAAEPGSPFATRAAAGSAYSPRLAPLRVQTGPPARKRGMTATSRRSCAGAGSCRSVRRGGRASDDESRWNHNLGRFWILVLDAPERQVERRAGECWCVLGDGGECDAGQAGDLAVVVPDQRQLVGYPYSVGADSGIPRARGRGCAPIWTSTRSARSATGRWLRSP